MINELIDHLAWVVAKACMRGHSTETVPGDGLPNFYCEISEISEISHAGWKEKRASGAGGSRGMDVRTEARCGEEARTYPASELSYTGFSSAGVAVSQVVKTAQSRGRTERTLLSAAPSRGARNAADRLHPSLLMSHYGLLHPTHHADKR